MTQDGPDALAVSARDGSGVSGLTMSLILPVELRDLRYFLAVADELNFTRAAQQLHMSQQALSVAIRRLEQRLGVQLFDRSPRSVQLTSAGVALVPAAQRTLAAAEHAVTQARDAAGGLIGRLTVGVSRSAYPFGAAVLRALLERTPGIELDMHQDYAQPLVDELLAGRIDAAIVYCPENNPALRYQRLSDQPAVASLHPNHSLAGTSTLSLEDLRDETLVLAQPAIGAGRSHRSTDEPGVRGARCGRGWVRRRGTAPARIHSAARSARGALGPNGGSASIARRLDHRDLVRALPA